MKKTILVVLTILSGLSFSFAQDNQTKEVAKPTSSLEWLNPDVNLGNIPKGVPATATYEFINNGDKPVVITNVRTSCGCTSKSYNQVPIKPGEKSTIEATYNAASVGNFHKTVTVTTNEGTAPKVLKIRGVVVVEEAKK